MRNTSKTPPRTPLPDELVEYRRLRKNGQSYESLKKRRRARKELMVQMRGGSCVDCGYRNLPAALEFHHRDPETKSFEIGAWYGTLERLIIEAEKCDLLCANCHRMRHAVDDADRGGDPVVEHRRRRKVKAVEQMGGRCEGCYRVAAPAIFEFHHRNAKQKEFGISKTGVPVRWEKILAELAKCVMLCANCHREVHAGYRDLEMLHGLAEDQAEYVA